MIILSFIDRNLFEIESAFKQRDLFKRYCNGEYAFNEEDMITSAPFVFK
jgi:hypothetical protein